MLGRGPAFGLAALLMAGFALTPAADAAPKGRKGGGPGGACKVTAGTDIAIYVGGGTGANSQLWAEALIDFWKTGARVPGEPELLNAAGETQWAGDDEIDYVTLTLSEFNDCTAADFAGLDVFLMPGGSAYEIQDSLGAGGKSVLTAYLDGGGNYLGFCAGGYYAARGYYWKGDDGAPTDTCRNQFCRYEVAGTFSFDDLAGDFTVQEWGGTSYHSNLLAYGPMADVLVEGPIEEIAGPWHADSDPNHPYDSHLIATDDPAMPELRVIYWGGATENYIYTANAPWGSEHAHYTVDPEGNDDLDFPQDGSLWALKSVASGAGGRIMLTSAHLEASLFHKAAGFENGGMTECQQYNNYTYLLRRLTGEMGLGYLTPDYDLSCPTEGLGEVKETAFLFPDGLAYRNAPRIDEGGGGGGDGGGGGSDGGGGGNLATGFDDGTLGAFTLSGSARRPWAADAEVACAGTHAARAGHAGGVDGESTISVTVPAGMGSAAFRYSYPSALDAGDDFHVMVNGTVVRAYETGPGAVCAADSVAVSPGDVLQFRCRSGGNGETCTVDDIVFR
jgi:hypothetical protein